MESARSGRVESATVEGRSIKWVSTDKKRYVTYSPGDIWMVGDLVKYGVKVEARPEEEQSFLAQIFISWFPMLLLIGVWIFFMRRLTPVRAPTASSAARKPRTCARCCSRWSTTSASC